MQAVRGLIVAFVAVLWASAALAAEQFVVKTPELVIKHSGNDQTCAFPASGYSDFKLKGKVATLTLEGQALPAGSRKVMGGGVSEVSWTPGDKSTQVTIEFATAPQSSLLNAVDGTTDRPHTPQVMAGFLFAPDALSPKPGGMKTALGARNAADSSDQTGPDPHDAQPGTFKLPQFPPSHYSDALVSLKVQNADFRDILFLMSRIGNVSIMIDPYYDDDPTGSKRSGKGGGTGGSGQGSGQQGGSSLPGQGPGRLPTDNSGYVTMNLKDVPFDQALDLILQSAGLVKTDVYPNS